MLEQAYTVDRFLLIERSPEANRLPHFDAFLKLRLLELNADAVLQFVNVAKRIQTQHRDCTPVRLAQTFDALHGCGFSRAVGANQPKNLTFVHLERHFVHGHGPAVGLADSVDSYDGTHECAQLPDFTNAPEGYITDWVKC